MNLLCQQHRISNGSIEVGCDGMEAVKAASRFQFEPNVKISHFDMVSTLHQLINDSPLTWSFRHIKGHQDERNNFHELTEWEQMNVIVDSRAKSLLWTIIESGYRVSEHLPIKGAVGSLKVNHRNVNTTIYSNVQRSIKNLLQHLRAADYWNSKGMHINYESPTTDILTHATNNSPLWQHRWLSKWFSGMCGVGRWLYRWKEQSHSKCPRCLTDDETVNHVIHCQHEDAANLWETGIEDICDWIDNNNGLVGMSSLIAHCLKQWQHQGDYGAEPYLSDDLHLAAISQDEMGWNQFQFGLVSPSLVQL